MWTEEKLLAHLRERGMDPDKYQLALDPVEGVVTYPLHNGSGKWVGYQAYRPDKTSKKMNDELECRYYTYLPSGVDGMFGIDQIDPTKRTIYIVEGVFKAAFLHRLGYNAIAVLTSHPKRLKPYFRIMKQTWDLIAIGDNDPAGQKLVNTVKKGFQSPVDIDEMSDYAVIHMLQSYSAGG